MNTPSRLSHRLVAFLVGATALVVVCAFAGGAGAVSDNAGANGIAHANSEASDHQSSGNAGTAGVVTEPQPLSTADDNGVGANVPGPYDSTRDGSPSMNGSDTGLAVGQACAGCVGQADNKNPQGQLPGGSDANAGYECDRNHGIGQTNPAHTGCVSSTVTPPEVVTPPGGGTPPAGSTQTPPAGSTQAPLAAVAGESASAANASTSGLPRTGSDTALAIGVGAALVFLGTAALLGARVRRCRWSAA